MPWVDQTGINCDLDGVLFDLVAPLCEAVYKAFRVLIAPADITEFNPLQAIMQASDCSKMSPLEAKNYKNAVHCFLLGVWSNPETYRRAPVYPGYFKVISEWSHGSGYGRYSFRFLTQRGPFRKDIWDATQARCAELGLHGPRFHVTDKVGYLRSVPFTQPLFVIEDRHKTCFDIGQMFRDQQQEEAAASGQEIAPRMVAMINRPWNHPGSDLMPPTVQRVLTPSNLLLCFQKHLDRVARVDPPPAQNET